MSLFHKEKEHSFKMELDLKINDIDNPEVKFK